MIRLLPMLLLAGCTQLMLPQYDNPDIRYLEPGRYEMCAVYEVYETPEEIALRCNHGIPGGNSMGCTFINARPRIVVVPMIEDSNDWSNQCIWGHEGIHAVFGHWHVDRPASLKSLGGD